MTNNSIDNALDAMEKAFEIDLCNMVSGTTYARAAVYGSNTLVQVLEEYAMDIGVDTSKKPLFMNKRTGQSISESDATVESLGLQEGDVLAISDAGVVA